MTITKLLYTCIISLLMLTLSYGQKNNPNYDSTLAVRLGADDYGMKSYTFVILKTGANKTQEKAFITKCFEGHMENINRLVEDKKLIVAGPMRKRTHL